MQQFNRQHLIRPKFPENLWLGNSITTNIETREINEYDIITGDIIERQGLPIIIDARINEISFSNVDDYMLVATRKNTVIPNNNTLYLVDRNGNRIWEREQTDSLVGSWSGVRDLEGDCYAVGGETPSNNPIRKYSRTGELLWTYTDTVSYNSCCIDYNNDFYAGRGSTTDSLRKFSPDSTLLWSRSFNIARGIAIDLDGNIWLSGTRVSNQTIRKYAPNGDTLLTIDTGARATTCWTDFNNNLVVACDKNSNINSTDSNLFKFDTNGTLLWQRLTESSGTANAFDVCIDEDNNVYISSQVGQDPTYLNKYDKDGTLLWKKTSTPTVIYASWKTLRVGKQTLPIGI
jgi:hypothetical protein